MQRRDIGDKHNILIVELILVGDLDKLLEQYLGIALNIYNVHGALVVSELDNMRQNVYHQAGILFPLVELIGEQPRQLLLLCVKRNDVAAAAANHRRVEGSAHILRHAQVVGAVYIVGAVVGAYHDNGDILQHPVFVHDLQKLHAVHLGHDHIQQHEQYIRALFLKYA